jgi:Cdc6-like AAA superfamily ATPase
MLKELTEGFIPPEIVGREKQVQELTQILERFKSVRAFSNKIIYGYTGTGKTAIVTNVLRKDSSVLYVSAAECKTSLRVLKEIAQTSYTTASKNISRIVDNHKENPRLLVLDEVNQIKDPEELFNYLNTIFRKTQMPMIIITNKRTITEDIPDDARTTLLFGTIELERYDALDLKNILLHRISLAQDFNASVIPEGTLEYICALAAREGSARLALALTYQCLFSMEFSNDFVDKVNRDIRFQDWKGFLMGLSSSELNFLKVLLRNVTEEKAVSTSVLYQDQYFKDLSPGRLSQLVTTFEKEFGFIKTEVKNQGRFGGRYRIVRFASKNIYDNILKFFEESGGNQLLLADAEDVQLRL